LKQDSLQAEWHAFQMSNQQCQSTKDTGSSNVTNQLN